MDNRIVYLAEYCFSRFKKKWTNIINKSILNIRKTRIHLEKFSIFFKQTNKKKKKEKKTIIIRNQSFGSFIQSIFLFWKSKERQSFIVLFFLVSSSKMINWQNQNKLRNKTTRRRKRRNLSFFSLEAFSLSLLLLLLVFHKKIWSHKNILSLLAELVRIIIIIILFGLFFARYFFAQLFLCSHFIQWNITHTQGMMIIKRRTKPTLFHQLIFFWFLFISLNKLYSTGTTTKKQQQQNKMKHWLIQPLHFV